jgi:fibronectin type 3 domain-containing protein
LLAASWSSLGGTATQVACRTDYDGNLDAFAIFADGTVRYKQMVGGTWSLSWQSLGGYAQQMAVATNSDNTLEVFIVGGDHALWHDRELATGGWTGWQSLGGYVTQVVAQENSQSDLMEVYAVGGDHAVWEIHQTSNLAANWQTAWSSWTSCGGYLTQIAVAPSGPDQLSELFGIGADNAVLQNWQTSLGPSNGNAIWSGWNSLGGYAKQVVVQQNQVTNAAELFIVGGDNAVWDTYQVTLPTSTQPATWSSWSSLHGYVSQIYAWWDSVDQKIDLSVIGYENAVWNNIGSGDQWSGWSTFGGYAQQITGASFTSDPSSVTGVGIVGGDNAVWVYGPISSSVTTGPAAPTGLDATPFSATQINLSWTAPSGTVTGYNVYRGSSPGGESNTALNNSFVTGTTYNDSTASSGMTYYYTVEALNPGGLSAVSAEEHALTVPAAPSDFAATSISATQINLTWTNSTGNTVSGYNIYRGTSSGGESSSPLNGGTRVTSASYSDNTCVAGTTYYYTIEAVNASGSSMASSETSALTAPTGLTATDDPTYPSTQIDLSWAAAGGPVTSYNVYRGTTPGGENYSTLIYSGASTGFNDTGLTVDITYYYTVKVVNGSLISAASNEVNATTRR